MSPNGTQSFGAHYVWYIEPPDTLNGCLFCLLKTIPIRRTAAVAGGLALYEAYEIGVALSE